MPANGVKEFMTYKILTHVIHCYKMLSLAIQNNDILHTFPSLGKNASPVQTVLSMLSAGLNYSSYTVKNLRV